jgi:hypothetical protein
VKVTINYSIGILTLTLLVGLSAPAASAFFLTGTQHLDVTTSNTNGILYDNSTADILAGGYIETAYVNDSALLSVRRPSGSAVGTAKMYNFGTTHFHSGYTHYVYVYDSSTLLVSGGSLYHVYLNQNSHGSIFGGSVSGLWTYDNSTLSVQGGSISNLFPRNNAIISIKGGTISSISALGNAAISLSGGSPNNIAAGGSSTFIFHASDFRVTGGLSLSQIDLIGGVPQYRVVGTGVLTGTWADGSGFITNITTNSGSIYAVPEPATVSLLAMGLAVVVAKRRRGRK